MPVSRMSISAIPILIFITGGFGMIVFGTCGVIQAHASAKWPHVPGQITHSEIRRRSGSIGRRSEVYNVTYSPLIRYSYSVGGQVFSGERVCFGIGGMAAGAQFAQVYTERYPVGSSVPVYYDPSKPSSSVLDPGISKRAFIPMAFGFSFAIGGGCLALLCWLFRP